MKLSVLALGATCLSCVTPAVHADFNADGMIAIGGFIQGDEQLSFGFGDFALAYETGPWRASLGMFGVVGRLHETYADISYLAGQTRITVGFPRPAYDTVAISPFTKIMPQLSLETIGISRSRATYGTMYQSDFLPYGAVVDGQAGGARYGLSLHGVPDWDVTIAGLGLAFATDRIRIEIGLEAVDQEGAIDWNAKAQITKEVGDFTFGTGIYMASANTQPDVLEGFASYAVTDQWKITGILRSARDEDVTHVIGVGHAVTQSVSVDLGVAATGTDDLAVETALRYSF